MRPADDPRRGRGVDAKSLAGAERLISTQVVATFDFAEVQPGDLGFKAGDVIYTDAAAFAAAGASGGWISGEINGKTGSFPSNYVAPK